MRMENEKNKFCLIIAIASVLIVLAFFVGRLYENHSIAEDGIKSIATCHSKNQILRLYHDDSRVEIECFGTLPDVDIHTKIGG